jgi:hypothetical protein
MNKIFSTLLAGSLLATAFGAAQAAVMPVADFTTSTFSYSYSGGANGTLTGTASGIFHFDSLLGGAIGGYNPIVGDSYNVNITITANDSLGSGNDEANPLDNLDVKVVGTSGAFNGVTLFEVTTGTATNGSAIAGQGGSLNIVGPEVPPASDLGSTSGSIVASNDGLSFGTPPYVKYSSSVINTLETGGPGGLTEENASLALTSNAPASYSTTANPFVDTLNANTFFIAGNFAANVPATTPEPGAVALGLVSLASCGVLRLRRRK